MAAINTGKRQNYEPRSPDAAIIILGKAAMSVRVTWATHAADIPKACRAEIGLAIITSSFRSGLRSLGFGHRSC